MKSPTRRLDDSVSNIYIYIKSANLLRFKQCKTEKKSNNIYRQKKMKEK